MRRILALGATVAAVVGVFACQPPETGTTSGGGGADAGAAGSDGGPVVQGANCGIESRSGAELCAATSKCPTLVVDTQAMPHCGFRIRESAVDLVCACGTSVCPMGIFATCAEGAALLKDQSEQLVCIQVAEGRCFDSTAPTTTSTSGSQPPKNPACDRACVASCGGGAACAAVCNCD